MGFKSRTENKTRATNANVVRFLAGIEPAARRADGFALFDLYSEVCQCPPVLWGDSIVGYGSYHYQYDSGRKGDFLRAGFSPRKSNLSVYVMAGFDDMAGLLAQLGPHKHGVSCLYIRRLADIDTSVLQEILRRSWQQMNRRYP